MSIQGGYGEANTAGGFHRLDPRSRIVATALLALGAASAHTWVGWLFMAVVVTGIYVVAGIPTRRVIQSLRPFLLLALLTVLLREGGGGVTLWSLGPWRYTSEDLQLGLWHAGRILLLLASASWLTMTTPASRVVQGLRQLLAPLEWLGVRLDRFCAAVLIALRIMPVMVLEARWLGQAQKARGVDLVKGPRGVWRRLSSLVLPFFASALRRSDRMADALMVRGYSGWLAEGERAYLGRSDALLLLAAGAAAAAAMLL